jgi:hypothetical protein
MCLTPSRFEPNTRGSEAVARAVNALATSDGGAVLIRVRESAAVAVDHVPLLLNPAQGHPLFLHGVTDSLSYNRQAALGLTGTHPAAKIHKVTFMKEFFI